jgi:hypothetical protein
MCIIRQRIYQLKLRVLLRHPRQNIEKSPRFLSERAILRYSVIEAILRAGNDDVGAGGAARAETDGAGVGRSDAGWKEQHGRQTAWEPAEAMQVGRGSTGAGGVGAGSAARAETGGVGVGRNNAGRETSPPAVFLPSYLPGFQFSRQAFMSFPPSRIDPALSRQAA